ncbi:MAG: heavy metal translocating P-type ATPase [Okeania sp. SIO2G4]|uniref:heavy metal translocating P-type ATPase n=1 Tax=unclassified Okeania TaxID=2634635 RepID=UPI0013B61D26|nr:heavy metal translocating P-type ATPase [Okeania sp. SIO2G5]NEP92359.1 heavy metal translocating P-type ATPase [Okeania sp. SIO2F5]NEQ89913.1 heavy metal translocating P-type ATPase [Okeania sp. SIO2G4]
MKTIKSQQSGSKSTVTVKTPTISLVHGIPGRVRLRVMHLSLDKNYTDNVQTLLESDIHVKQTRINQAASSIAINYQTKGKSETEILDHLIYLIENVDRSTVTVFKKKVNSQTPPETEHQNEGELSSLVIPSLATLLAFLGGPLKLPISPQLSFSALAIAAFPVVKRAFQSLFIEHCLNIDCLDFLSLTLGAIQGKVLTPALVLTLHELGDVIREQTARSTEHQTSDLLDTIGRFAWVEKDGEEQQIPSDQVKRGDTVIVYPGEQIPVDGEVLQGEAVIDQQQLTGESMPVVGKPGTLVYASTLVRSGQIYIRAERVGKQTRAAASIELLQKAPVHDTRMANYASQMADKLILPSLILAGIVLATTHDPSRAASILTLDFVTGIRVSVPTAFLGALNHTTRHGILVRSGRTLEMLAEIDTIVFDKTGTLTQGNIAVVGVETVSGRMSATEVLALAASAEQRITHPVAEAIARYAQEQGVNIYPRGEWDYKVGLGIQVDINGQDVLVGSAKFLTQAGVDLDCFYENHPCFQESCAHPDQECPVSEWLSLIYVACNGEFQGAIQYKDPVRPESMPLIMRLQQEYGMEVHLLTGDNEVRAKMVATELKIPESQVHAEAFPDQKAAIVRELRRTGKTVAFVGDGLNDSVALAYADVSVSFENGSDVARETADVVLMNNNLSSLLEAIAIAKQTKHLIEQNTVMVVGPNLVALGLASTVGLHPLIATVVHNGSAIAAGLNSLRPLVQHQLESGTY